MLKWRNNNHYFHHGHTIKALIALPIIGLEYWNEIVENDPSGWIELDGNQKMRKSIVGSPQCPLERSKRGATTSFDQVWPNATQLNEIMKYDR